MQIARITNVQNWYFERVVFPGQRLIFEAVSTAQLEIHCGMMASAILSDTIPCDRLKVPAEEEKADDGSHESRDVAEDNADSNSAAESYAGKGRPDAVDESDRGDVHLPGEAVQAPTVSKNAALRGQKVVVAAAASC